MITRRLSNCPVAPSEWDSVRGIWNGNLSIPYLLFTMRLVAEPGWPGDPEVVLPPARQTTTIKHVRVHIWCLSLFL